MNMVHSICRKSPRAVSKKETVYATRRRGEGAPLRVAVLVLAQGYLELEIVYCHSLVMFF